MLTIDRLNVVYDGVDGPLPALRDFSLDLARGESYGLVGESGCGKSTLAFTVLGYLPANGRTAGGRIAFEGQSLIGLDEPAWRRLRGAGIAMVYQDAAQSLNPVLTIGRQLREVCSVHYRMSRRQTRTEVLEMLARVRFDQPAALLGRYPHQLSGGQQQRVVIAMALLARPRLLILDEPTTGLDVTVEAEVVDLIAELAADRTMTLLYISHNLGLIARVCERVGVMYAGELVEQAPVAELFHRPRHPYTAGLLACRPDPGGRAGARRLTPIPGEPPAADALPPGCAFAPRCRHALPGRCDVTPGPGLRILEPRHRVRCVRAEQIDSRPPATVTAGSGSTAREPLLTIDGLSKNYSRRGFLLSDRGAVSANDRVSLELRQGELLALVGETGSGKSTLARILVGLESASAGHARFGPHDLAWLPVRRRPRGLIRALQMIFQNPDATLNPVQRIGDLLARAVYRLSGLRGRAGRQRVQDLLTRMRLDAHLARSLPPQLSGGQRQRVAIARAFAGQPEVVIADEPVSALDVSVQAAVVNLLVDLQEQQGTTILFISHDLALVRWIADRVAVMYRGRVVESGPVEQVFSPPCHPYTEALLAAVSPPDPKSRPIRIPGGEPLDPPASTGCCYADRCHRRLGALCDQQPPPERETDSGHRIACHIPLAELVPVGLGQNDARRPVR